MNSHARGGRNRHNSALLLGISIYVSTGSLAFAQGIIEPVLGAPGTPLAVTGEAVARENSARTALSLWGPYQPGIFGEGGADDHALRAWLWEQRIACMTHGHGGLGYGTMGYGGTGLDLGFYGFGLSFHLGYGYGGRGLGVGATGGDPYYAGPGYPSDSGTGFFTVSAPLVVDPAVALEAFDQNRPDFPGDYGQFTGAIPYPETRFAPFAAAAATGGKSAETDSRPTGPNPVIDNPPPGPR
jgi:hypothetical protein